MTRPSSGLRPPSPRRAGRRISSALSPFVGEKVREAGARGSCHCHFTCASRNSCRLRMTASPSLHIRGHFGGEIIAAFLDPFAELVALEAGHDVLAAVLLPRGSEVVADRLLVLAGEPLLEQAPLSVALLHLAGDHLLDDVLRLSGPGGLISRALPPGIEVL